MLEICEISRVINCSLGLHLCLLCRSRAEVWWLGTHWPNLISLLTLITLVMMMMKMTLSMWLIVLCSSIFTISWWCVETCNETDEIVTEFCCYWVQAWPETAAFLQFQLSQVTCDACDGLSQAGWVGDNCLSMISAEQLYHHHWVCGTLRLQLANTSQSVASAKLKTKQCTRMSVSN